MIALEAQAVAAILALHPARYLALRDDLPMALPAENDKRRGRIERECPRGQGMARREEGELLIVVTHRGQLVDERLEAAQQLGRPAKVVRVGVAPAGWR